ncbi:MAG: zinc ribbon domain-containing protein [Bacteroidetes bacterium]|nr:zinc ribbon domain-containing protein [Bacteroidota bacterium]
MNTVKICRNCNMPLSNSQLLGTEKDGSKNYDYCKYCYAKGEKITQKNAFVRIKPNSNLNCRRGRVIERQ